MANLSGVPVDPRFIQQIQSSPTMRAEQGAGFMSDFGGPSSYMVMSNLQPEDRLIYSAVLRGETTPEDIASVTALDLKRVEVGLTSLGEKGLISSQEVETSE